MTQPGAKPGSGFTLIELSIVLIIIGLIIGGILVGQDLIQGAAVRATISQIEKYNSAVNTFRSKYAGLPGDLPVASANQFGFVTAPACNGNMGARDGNGLLDGGAAAFVLGQNYGEPLLFWQDLSTANLIDGAFPGGGAPNSGGPNGTSATLTLTPGITYLGNYFPAAKLSPTQFILVYETSGSNWYGIEAITQMTGGNGVILANATIPVSQAYNIDKKIDDGAPTTGSVRATYLNNSDTVVQTANAQSSDTGSSCYNTSTNAYSTTVNNGAGPNCALSLKMQ